MKKVMKAVAAIMLMAAVICATGCKKEDIDDSINGHGYVDLGLPSGTLWATCNVGADVPEDYGDYFAWGETQPKSIYNWETYKYGRENKLTKYCTNSDYGLDGFVDGLFVLLSADDASTVNWGEGWHIPTVSEWDEMVDNCSQKAARLNGVKGIRYTGPNGNSIFLPLAGYRWDGDLFYNGEYGLYWSSCLNTNNPNNAWFIRNNWVSNDKGDNYCRSNGRSIRPVRTTSPSGRLPQVTTSEVSVFYNNSAVCGGNVISDGGSTVMERGVCWSTDHNPTVNGSHASADLGLGSFTVNATGLTPATTYYVRAYATNSVGTAYGNEVEFNTGNGGGDHEYVDLGLPSGTLWATCNVGANTPEGVGNFFAWGETEPKDYYDWNTYQYCNGSENTLTKYCFDYNYGNNGFADNLTILQHSDDAATVNWGAEWCIPTAEQWEELRQNTTCIWTTQNGIDGRLFVAANGNSLFMPVTGNLVYDELDDDDEGRYWLNTLDNYDTYRSWGFYFNSIHIGINNTYRCIGCNIRAVRSTLPNAIPEGAINGLFSVGEGQ